MPLLAAQPASAASVPFSSGSLDWGIKASFRDYLASPGTGGAIAVTGGAAKNADGTFDFKLAKASYDTTTHTVTSSFTGGLHITGHGGLLDITLADLHVDTSGSTATLTADVSSKQMSGGTFSGDDVALVTFTAGQDTFDGAATATKLTADGEKAFSGFYTAGTAMDPVKVLLKTATAPTAAPTTAKPSSGPTVKPTTGGGSTPSRSAVPTSAPATTSSSAPVTASAPGSADSSAPAAVVPGGTGGSAPALATTGADGSTLPLALTGTALVLAGGTTAVLLRRRRAGSHS
ncbi:HtaA domain-containing protein [Streptacidiphilus cavernicola]|uniref:HtaA domain-containing protein n=1 Tax=Streptacidiphilus cavernicola TaxID=3342716 RepID=A0ABV6VXU7_9ACTN